MMRDSLASLSCGAISTRRDVIFQSKAFVMTRARTPSVPAIDTFEYGKNAENDTISFNPKLGVCNVQYVPSFVTNPLSYSNPAQT